MFRWHPHTILLASAASLVALASFVLPLPIWASGLLGLFHIVLTVYGIKHARFGTYHPWLGYGLALVTLLSFITLTQTILFYAIGLPYWLRAITSLASPALALGTTSYAPFRMPLRGINNITLKGWAALFSIAIPAVGVLSLIVRGITDRSVVTPWALISPSVFILYFALICITLLALYRTRYAAVALPVVLLIAAGVATILFPLGFGFDPFIHQASERLLANTGTITPKPLYYVGYYVSVLWGSELMRIPLFIVDRFSSLALILVMLPLIFVGAFRYLQQSGRLALLSPLGLLIFPVAELIQSTPQAMSYVWSLIGIVLLCIYLTARLVPPWLLIAISLTALAVHPLTGLPLMLFVVFGLAYNSHLPSALRTASLWILGVAVALGIPASLWLAGILAPDLNVTVHIPNFGIALQALLPRWPLHFTKPEDIAYSYQAILVLVRIILAALGIWWLFRRHSALYKPLLAIALSIVLAYGIVASCLTFDFATADERIVFSMRLLTLAWYVLLPLCIFGLQLLIERAYRISSPAYVAMVLLIALAATASWYLSYPRFDTRSQSHGYTASQADYDAVRWIHSRAEGSSYVVLANQTVSAVAIREYGFLHYHNNMLYYPLPTNSRLYTSFLEVMSPTAVPIKVIGDIKKQAGVQTVYVVLNSYWDKAAQVRENLQAAATTVADTGGGQVLIFEYQ